MTSGIGDAAESGATPPSTPSDTPAPLHGTAAGATSSQEVLELADPWRRFWARASDTWIEMFVVASVVPGLVPALWVSLQTHPGGELLARLMLLPVALVLDAACTAVLGTTVGKAIAGIRLCDVHGQKLFLLTLLRRNLGVWLWGFGLGIPLLNLVAMWKSKQRVDTGHQTIWDTKLQTRCFVEPGTGDYVLRAFASFAAIALVLTGYGIYKSTPKAILADAVREVKSIAPQMIDELTRLDGAVASPDGELIYDYTFVAMRPANEEIQEVRESLAGKFTRDIIEGSCNDRNIHKLLELGVPVVFRYSDAVGRRLVSVHVDLEVCKKR